MGFILPCHKEVFYNIGCHFPTLKPNNIEGVGGGGRRGTLSTFSRVLLEVPELDLSSICETLYTQQFSLPSWKKVHLEFHSALVSTTTVSTFFLTFLNPV